MFCNSFLSSAGIRSVNCVSFFMSCRLMCLSPPKSESSWRGLTSNKCAAILCSAVHCIVVQGDLMKNPWSIWQRNRRSVRSIWGKLGREEMDQLRSLTTKYRLSVAAGDVQLLQGRWYVTHSGLVGIAQRRRCSGIRTAIVKSLSDPATYRWVFRATVYKTAASAGFVGYGDADPSNVSFMVRGSEMRVAETRAVNRALRKAYGIGLCSLEELGHPSSPGESPVGRIRAIRPIKRKWP